MELNSNFFKIKTTCNSLELDRQNDHLELRSVDGALQSRIDLEKPHRLALKNLEYLAGVLLFAPPPKHILILGTAAGSLLHFLRYHYDAAITAVDFDTELIEKMLDLKILPSADSNLSYIHDDAAHFIEHCRDHYDLILVDIFEAAQSPRWLLEKAYLTSLYGLLNDSAAIAFNLLIDSDHDFTHFYRNLRLVCQQQTLCTAVEGFENTIAFGFRNQLPKRDLSWYLEHAQELSRTHDIDYLSILSAIYTTNPEGSL